ncbi:hypothetical protein KKF32_02665, partial [Patescibacteria group bacterium]|nr:hypothetical protein [Patescibacteria group bacterium]
MKRKNILIIILILVLFLFFNNNPFFIQAAGESNLGLQIEPLYQCADGLDNDGDGLIDYPNDPGCSSASDNDETDPSVAQCADGLDNDGDGLIDYPNDPGCSSASDNDEY